MGVPVTGPRVGALDVPVPVAALDKPGGDPGLEVLVAFVAAVIKADLQDAWASLRTPHQTEDVVHEVFTHKLEAPQDFNEGLLPALHAWRETGQSEQIACDYAIERSTLVVEWVFPAGPQDPDRRRPTFVNAVGKAVLKAIRRERHPAFVVDGDDDPQAPTRGSLLWRHAGFWRESRMQWRRSTYDLDRDTGSERRPDARYLTARWEIEVEERVEDEPDPELQGLDATLTQVSEAGPGFTISFEAE